MHSCANSTLSRRTPTVRSSTRLADFPKYDRLFPATPRSTNSYSNLPSLRQVKGADGADAPDDVAIFVNADLSDEGSVKKALLAVIKKLGGVDGLVNVPPSPSMATSTPSLLHDLDLSVYQNYFSSEVHTPLLCAKQVSAVMKGAGRSVVFVVEAGDRGLAGGEGNVAAVSALTASAAAAAGPDGIRINCVSHALGGHGGGCGGHGSMPMASMRSPSAEDVAMQVAHLLSDKTAFVTGQTIAADSVRFGA